MNILITGGAGYIGSVLTPLLLANGHNVTVVDSFMYRQTSLLDCCVNKNLTVINGDARDEKLMAELIKGKDLIIPLAALVGFPLCEKNKIDAENTNFGAVDLVLKLRDKDTQKVIFPCTNSGYGVGEKDIYCTEETPINPISLYGRTKMRAETAVLGSGNSLTFRFATLFGASPRMRTDLLVNDFTYRAIFDRTVVADLADGENTIEFELVNSMRNTWGPLHHKEDESFAVGPQSFTFEGQWSEDKCAENYKERYSFMRFGLNNITLHKLN